MNPLHKDPSKSYIVEKLNNTTNLKIFFQLITQISPNTPLIFIWEYWLWIKLNYCAAVVLFWQFLKVKFNLNVRLKRLYLVPYCTFYLPWRGNLDMPVVPFYGVYVSQLDVNFNVRNLYNELMKSLLYAFRKTKYWTLALPKFIAIKHHIQPLMERL